LGAGASENRKPSIRGEKDNNGRADASCHNTSNRVTIGCALRAENTLFNK
jgi:hypothetical protein